MALDTPVAADVGVYQPIQAFQVGDTVLAAGADLQWSPVPVRYSQGTTGRSRQPFTIFVEYGAEPDTTSLIVTADHLFLLPDGTLKRADRLSTQDELVLADGSGAAAITSVIMGDYYGGFHHIATSTTAPGEDLSGHLLNTNGVVSADYAVQLFHRTGEFQSRAFNPEDDRLPIVGTRAYVEQHGEGRELQPYEQLGFGRIAGTDGTTPGRAESGPDLGNRGTNVFVPAARTLISVPPDAASFVSREDAETLRELAPQRAFDDPLAQQWAESLNVFYKAFYPEITFTVDWYDDDVNAYAWVENGVRRVAIKGGLVRTDALEIEGLALILAHEVGHHYGGPPTFPSGLSCEGQADYYGARNVMRKVWFGEQYLTMMEAGIAQLGDFFGFLPHDDGHGAAAAGCSHPPGSCRVQTYEAAVRLQPKPACAS